MAVMIRPMTTEEFEVFRQWSVAQQARELTEERRICLEDAIREATAEFTQMLPQGLDTARNFLMTVTETDRNESVGFVWTLQEETHGCQQSFLCDFAIREPMRRKGYATAALQLVEAQAMDAGCQESVLFVSDRNEAAKALYRKCGYRALRSSGHGAYMIKQLK